MSSLRRGFDRAACAALLVAAFALGGGCSPARPKTILLISIDTLRADRLGAYGYPRPTTPTLDALAANGVLFENTVAQSPWTVPSHATMLTGLHPHHHGVVTEHDRLPDDVPTLATILGEAGFLTAAVVQTTWLNEAQGFGRGFRHFQQIPDDANGGALVTRAAEGWLRAFAGQPLFLFLHYYDVHSEYRPSPIYRERFTRPYDGPVNGSTLQLQEVRAGSLKLTERDIQQLSDLYDAEIRQLDDALGQLFALLDELGIRDDTLVVVASDHGEEFMEHGGVLHGRTLYEEVLDVPLIVSGPGVPRGERVGALAALADVTPTILARVGITPPDNLDGIDLLARGRGGREPQRRVVAAADHNNTQPDSLRMIRDLDHKLIVDRISGAEKIFDLTQDPGEKVDLAAQKPSWAIPLRAELAAYLASSRKAPQRAARPEEEIERLRALGYFEN